MTDGNRWLQLTDSEPGHAQWYIERFRTTAASHDLDGEAGFVDDNVPFLVAVLAGPE